MRVRLLGPLDVQVGDDARPVPGVRRRAVLAVLALHPGEVVSTDRLMDVVWGDRPPATASNTLQSHISALRGMLPARTAIVAHAPGYRLDLGPDGTDVQVAERLIRQGIERLHGQQPGEAAAHLREAVELWRGEPLLDLAGLDTGRAGRSPLAEEAERLIRLRLEALEALTEARLALGEHAALVPELERRVREHPFHEPVHAQLMLALYRAGRQAEALAVYQRLRTLLRDELGIDPTPALREREAAILRQDPALAAPDRVAGTMSAERGPGASASKAAPVPRQLPPDVYGFTGRDEHLAELGQVLDTGGPPVAPIRVICGSGGVGKTALAVHWAHRMSGLFPDGQLYLDLRGAHPDEPLRAEEALAAMLAALGVADLPADLAARSALYRSTLADRRVLILLDNALDAAQVRPLLPGVASCRVVVTSRNDLAGLVARDGARRINLDVLPAGQTAALLRTLIGARVDEEPAAAAELAAQCAWLPLALRIAADLVVARRDARIADLVGDLRDGRSRLDLLNAGADDETAVRAVFSWSERHLPAEAVRLFWLCGLHPGRDLDPGAAGALAGVDPDEAARLADLLGRTHLLEPAGAGRWSMHDLLRVYARDRADSELAAQDRQAASIRLYDYYLGHLRSAVAAVYPEDSARFPVPDPHPLPDPAAAREWLDAERLNLVAAARGATGPLAGYAVELARPLAKYLEVGYHNQDGLAVFRQVLEVAMTDGDLGDQAMALHGLARAHSRDGRYAEASDLHRKALGIYRRIGDRAGQAASHVGLGITDTQQGRYADALAAYERGLALLRGLGDLTSEARSLSNIARILWLQGHHEDAVDRWQQAMAVHIKVGNRSGLGRVLNALGNAYQWQRRYADAYDHHSRALEVLSDVGDRAAEACALTDLGRVHSRTGRHVEAFDHHRRALALFRAISDRVGETEVLIDIGDAYARTDRHAEAIVQHSQAHEIALALGDRLLIANALNGHGRSLTALGHAAEALALHRLALDHAVGIGDPHCKAAALDGLSDAHQSAGDHDEARRRWQEALEIYVELGLPNAEDRGGRVDSPV